MWVHKLCKGSLEKMTGTFIIVYYLFPNMKQRKIYVYPNLLPNKAISVLHKIDV